MIKIFNFPKYYSISIDTENDNIKIFSSSKHAKGRELKQTLGKHGYLSVKLNNKDYKIHYLVSHFMIGERPKNLVTNHIDGNKLNNNYKNLEYISASENIYHSIKMGLHICNRRELMGRYIDGRCSDPIKYKHDWYIQNRERILNKVKQRYNDKKSIKN